MSIGALETEADLARWVDQRLDRPSRINMGLSSVQGAVDELNRVRPVLVSSLPSDPVDGQEIYYAAAPGVLWHFRFNAASSSAYKWEAVSGTPVLEVNNTPGLLNGATSYVNFPQGSVSIPIPLDGDYDIEVGVAIRPQAAGGGRYGFSTNAAGNNASATHSVTVSGPAFLISTGSITTRAAALTGGNAVVDKGLCLAAGYSVDFFSRRMALSPVRVG